MRRSVTEWFEKFNSLPEISSNKIAKLILDDMMGADRDEDLDQLLANALTAFRMLPIISHQDTRPWHMDLPNPVRILTSVPLLDIK